MSDLYGLDPTRRITNVPTFAPQAAGTTETDESGVARITAPVNLPGVYDDKAILDISLTVDDPVAFLDSWELAKKLAPRFPGATPSAVFENLDTYKDAYFSQKSIPVKSGLRAMADEFRAFDILNETAKLANALANEELGLPAFRMNLASGAVSGRDAIIAQMATNLAAVEELRFDVVDRGFVQTALKWTAGQLPNSIEAMLQAIMAGMGAQALVAAKTGIMAAGEMARGARGAASAAKAGQGLASYYESVGVGQSAGKAIAGASERAAAAVAVGEANAATVRSALTMARTIGGIETTTVGAMKTLALRDMATGALTFEQGLAAMRGFDYMDMVESGVDPGVASVVSLGSGAVGQALEQFFGLEPQVARLVTGAQAANLTSNIIKRLHGSGMLKPIAAFAARELIGTASETGAEVLQSINSNVATIVARSMADERISLSPADMEKMAGDVAQSFVQTLVTAPLLGIAPNVAAGIADHRAARDMAKAAPTMTREAFIGMAKDKKTFGENIPDDAAADIAGQVWDEQTKRAAEEESQRRDIMVAKAKTEADGKGPVGRDAATGGLDISTSRENGVSTYLLLAEPSPTGQEAVVRVTSTEDAGSKTVTFTDIEESGPEYSGHVDEMVAEIIASRPGWQFKADENAPFNLQGAVERQMKLLGAPDEALAPEEQSARARIRSLLDETGQFTPARREATIGAVQFLANASGKAFSSFVAPLRGIKVSGEEGFNRENWGMVEFTDTNGKPIPMTEMIRRAGATITLAENAGPVPFMHEMVHFMVPAMKQEDRSIIEGVYRITNGVWTAEHHERFVDELLTFLKEGRVSDEKARPVMERIAEWLRGLWRDFKALDLDPRIRALFEEWASRPAVTEVPSAGTEVTLVEPERSKGHIGFFERAGKTKEVYEVESIQNFTLVEKMMGSGDAGQGDLFGDDASDQARRRESAAMVEAKSGIVSSIRRRVSTLKAILGMANKADRREAMKEFGGDLKNLDDGKIEGQLSVIEAKLARWTSDTWIQDPSLIAEARKAAGLAYNDASLMSDVIEMAANDDGQAILFMTKREKDAYRDKAINDATSDAKEYQSAKEWVETGLNERWDSLDNAAKKWFEARFKYHKSGKAKKYPAKGDFLKFILVGKNLSDFLYAIDRSVNPRDPKSLSDVEARRSKRVRDLISKTSQLREAVENIHNERRMPNAKETKSISSWVARNEALAKFLYAEVSGDTDLGFEAMSELKNLPEIDMRRFTATPDITLKDMEIVLGQLKDEALRERVRSGTAKVSEIDRYERKIIGSAEKEIGKRVEKKTLSDFVKSARAESRMNVAEERARGEEKLAAYRLAQHARKLRAFIVSPIKGRMDNTFRKWIELIQDYIRNGQQVDRAAMPSLDSVVFKRSPESADRIIELVNGVSGKPFGEWTYGELQSLAGYIKELARAGRMIYQFNRANFGLAAQLDRQRIEEAIRKGRFYRFSDARGAEAEKNEEEARRQWFGLSFARPDAAIHKLETPKEGHERVTVISDILIRDHSRALEGKYSNVDRRTRPIRDFVTSKKIDSTLYDQVVVKGVGPMDTDLVITRNDLIGIRALVGTRYSFNQKQRDAFIQGVLFSEAEKQYGDQLTPAIPPEDEMYGDPHHKGDNYIMRMYRGKLDAILAATETMLTDDEKKLCGMMVDAMDSEADWTRFSEAVIDITGREMRKEKTYFPIMRSKPMEGTDDIVDAIVHSGVAPLYMETGMTLDRARRIAPHSQVAVRFDAMRMFFDSVEKQEHLANIGPYAKRVKAIFQDSHHSHGVQNAIKAAMGKEGLKYIEDLIDTIVNPNAFMKTNDGGELIAGFQGKKYVAYLSYRWSTFLMQMATSPMPFISEAPGELMAMVPEVIAAITKGHYGEFFDAIEERSGELRHRQVDPRMSKILGIYEKSALGEKVGKGIEEASQFGMKGLRLADRMTVAMGWEAVRRKKFQEYGKAGMSVEEAGAKAVEYANEVTRKTQVTNEPSFRAPAYRNMDGWKQMSLMFTAPLNVIWNNLAYDVPAAAKEEQFGKMIGLITAYALSGIIIGSLKVARGAVNAPDDDPDFWKWYWLLAASSQFTEAVPIVGKYLSGTVSAAITGRPMIFNSNALPLADTVTKALESSILAARNGMTEDKMVRLLDSGFEGVALITGLPYLGVKEWGFGKLSEAAIRALYQGE